MVFVFNGVIAFILGAFVGKFLAAVVHFLPKILLEESEEEREPSDIFKWFFQKPLCWHCQAPILWAASIPILGWVITRGKCSRCGQSFGVQVFLLELGTALLFGGSALFFPLDYPLLFVLLISCLLICCFVTDFEHLVLPDQFTMTIVWTGMIASLFPIFVTPSEAILGAVGGYGIFWSINVLYRYLRGFEGMYPGDFKLNAGIGACVGIRWLFLIILISLVFLVVGTIIRLLLSKKKLAVSFLYQEAPYGCYSSIVSIVFLFILLSGIYK